MTGSGPDGVLRLSAGGLELEFWQDHTYTRNSADNVHAYAREIAFAGEERHAWKAVGVRVSDGVSVLNTAVLLLPLGCGEPGADTLVARPGTLYLPVGCEVAALDLPSLKVRWETRSNRGCVLGLHEIPGEEALIVRREVHVARVEPDGRVRWEQGGRDVLSGDLRIEDGVLEVTDGNGDLYRFRVQDGERLAGPPLPPPPAAPSGPSGWLDRVRGWLQGR